MGRANIPYTETLTPRYNRIMDLCIRGLTSGEIAKELNMGINHVSQIIHAANFEHQLAIRRARYEEKHDESVLRSEEEATEVLRRSAREAAEKMVSLLEDESPVIQLKSASEILDRVGPSKRSGSAGAQAAVIVNISSADAAVIAETLEDTG